MTQPSCTIMMALAAMCTGLLTSSTRHDDNDDMT
eukprot:CAMPEP_0119107324 /NCGR_PEP_ID=MMETSP1180-20130426/9642_1 /TAXON_ID=3052 ORGANISM="Chlamydomonas cf sp, Strain CCMP681" /NCGR_SAMPLE_ID=MMETSP1180 /ASSEMBLY_ACC=CAM_ASM_000741 /LENGTH=33 /DNA_ID= /DNA_START= /DNA_END= /DNA_ORIENTATION=